MEDISKKFGIWEGVIVISEIVFGIWEGIFGILEDIFGI